MKLSAVVTLNGGFYFPDLLSGKTFEDRIICSKEYGFDAVEIWGEGLADRLEEVKKIIKKHDVEVSAVCSGFRGNLLGATKEVRILAFEDMKALLTMAGELGAQGMIMAPQKPCVPSMEPYKTSFEMEMEMFIEFMGRLSDHAIKAGTHVLIEPVNRYETHLFNRVDQAVDICKKVGSEGLKIIADTYHMNIEETNIAETFEKFGEYIYHVHLVDSNRFLPGQGHTDFAAIFKALKETGYDKSLSFECFAEGEAATAVRECVKLLNELRR